MLEAALAENPTPAQFAQIDASIAEYVERNYRTFVHAQALTVRSDAKLREGNPLGAAEDLDKSLEIYEGALVDDTRSRWSLRQSATQLYDRWTRIELDLLNSPAAAFEVAERAKEFSFFSFDFHASRLAKTRRVLSLEELRSTLPAEWQVLSYRILGNQLLTWKISKLDVAFTSKEFSRHELQAKIAEVRSKARSRKRLPAATSNYLSELLIGTIPANCSLLVIIPDQELNDLPFSLLNSGSSPLVDRIAVLVAPSAGTLAEARQRIVAAPTSNNVLVVSDPVVDKAIQHEFSLGELKSAGLEGIQVAAFYPGARHLAGPQATPENLYSRPFDYKLLHFASHAILDSKNPESSFLVLTSGRTGSSQLFQRDLYALKLTSAPLVVLSACETGRLTGAAGEGLSSLARAFLSAGASAVLATMWAVQDGSAAFMATAFHREFSAGVPAAEALRRAQAAYRRDSKLLLADPLGWSAFQLVGASR